MKPITSLVPWFGSNRTLAHHVGAELAGRTHVTVPFAGGMCELRHLTARTIVVGDLQRHLIVLASTLAHPDLGPKLIRRLRRWVFHPDALAAAQERCRGYDRDGPPADLVQWAEDYFVTAWMGRSGKAGTDGEFTAGLSVRWDGGGGDSALRYRNAVESLRDWRAVMPRCTFVVMDVFELLGKVKDRPECGVYCDPPFPDVGDEYRHKFNDEQHRELARRLAAFEQTRVVCRFYRHPLVAELYPASRWRWIELAGGKINVAAPEVLLVNDAGSASNAPAATRGPRADS